MKFRRMIPENIWKIGLEKNLIRVFHLVPEFSSKPEAGGLAELVQLHLLLFQQLHQIPLQPSELPVLAQPSGLHVRDLDLKLRQGGLLCFNLSEYTSEFLKDGKSKSQSCCALLGGQHVAIAPPLPNSEAS